MRKLTATGILLTVFFISCKKNPPEHNMVVLTKQPQAIVCGTVQDPANLSKESRDALSKNALSATVAGSLLIYIDFDGATVFPGNPIPVVGTSVRSPLVNTTRFCPAPGLTAAQKAFIVRLVEDDFSPFNIQVTTDVSLFNSYTPAANKELCIVSTFPSTLGMGSGVGGVSPFLGPGIRLPFNPCFVFSSLYGNPEDIAMTISHELGHTLGLIHESLYDGDCHFIFDYHPGFGDGPLSFAPIMGNGFNKRITNWFAQACVHPEMGVSQDDFVSINNQVTIKPDDFPDTPDGNKTFTSGPIDGILEKQGDVDYILINFKNPGRVTITSDNIDIKASLYNHGGHLEEVYDDPNDINVTIPSANGKRYLKIEAADNANMASRFMTGRYKVIF